MLHVSQCDSGATVVHAATGWQVPSRAGCSRCNRVVSPEPGELFTLHQPAKSRTCRVVHVASTHQVPNLPSCSRCIGVAKSRTCRVVHVASRWRKSPNLTGCTQCTLSIFRNMPPRFTVHNSFGSEPATPLQREQLVRFGTCHPVATHAQLVRFGTCHPVAACTTRPVRDLPPCCNVNNSSGSGLATLLQREQLARFGKTQVEKTGSEGRILELVAAYLRSNQPTAQLDGRK